MKKILGFLAAAVMVFSMAAITGCGDKEAVPEETTTTEATTTEPTTTTEETTKAETYKTMYQSKLDDLIDEYGSVNGGQLTDLDADGTPEMIVFSGQAPSLTTDIFTIQDKKAVNVYNNTYSGDMFFVSDASHEVLINESVSPSVVIMFDSENEWMDETIYAVSVSGGASSTETLKASTDEELDFPDFNSCECSINGETVSGSDYEVERDRLMKGADSTDPGANTLDSLKAALSE